MGLFWEEKVYESKRTSTGPRGPVVPAVITPRFERPASWQPCDTLPDLSGVVALDFETKDPGITEGRGPSWAFRGEGFICGTAISWDGGDFYLPTRHHDGNIDEERVLRWLAAQAAKDDVMFVMANAMYDAGWLKRMGIEIKTPPADVQGMAALLDENRFSYSLDTLAKHYLGEGKNTDEFVRECTAGGVAKPFANMDKVPAWVAEKYGVNDAVKTRALYHHLRPLIAADDLDRVYDLERECSLVAVDMRWRGVRVNLERAAEYRTLFEQKRDAALLEIKRITGIDLTPNENEAIARALKVENPRLELDRTATGKESIRKGALEAMNTPVATAVMAARRYEKAISTFFNGYLFGTAHNGRIHAEFHPLRRSDDEGSNGTVSGRFSSSNPNLQNIPARDPEVKAAVRGCFEPEEGEEWCKLDYAAQEPRLAVHMAALVGANGREPRLRGAAEMVARYAADPSFDMHGEVAGNVGIKRGAAKTLNLGILYGTQPPGLCDQLGLPTETRVSRSGREYRVAGPVGQRLFDEHAERYPFVKAFFERCQRAADERGYVRTIMGRRCHFPEKPSGGYDWTYRACNRVIQGSAADQMKMALVLLRRAGLPALLTVHDESDFSIPKGAEGQEFVRRAVEIMEGAIPLSVPVVADVRVGANWASVE